MTSSPTHPSLFFLAFPHPPLPAFFPPCLADAFPTLSEDSRRFFRRCSPPIRSQENLRKIGSQVSHDVSLMSFFIDFLHLRLIDISSDAFQQPIRSHPFPKIFPKIFRRCSPPIRSQEICDVIFVKLGLMYPITLLKILHTIFFPSHTSPSDNGCSLTCNRVVLPVMWRPPICKINKVRTAAAFLLGVRTQNLFNKHLQYQCQCR